MCDLTIKLNKESVTGYKVVAKHIPTGDYYSIAIGFKYKSPMNFHPRKRQKTIADYWNPVLKRSNQFHSYHMTTRTGCFKSFDKASKFAQIVSLRPDYRVAILKVRLTNDLMSGDYYYGAYAQSRSAVYAGHTMEIIEEM